MVSNGSEKKRKEPNEAELMLSEFKQIRQEKETRRRHFCQYVLVFSQKYHRTSLRLCPSRRSMEVL